MGVHRTVYAGEIGEALAGREVTVAGWVHRRRDHGGLIFIDLRDRSGIVQVVVTPERAEAFAAAERLRLEYVVRVRGTVRLRPPGMANPDLSTGTVEVEAAEIHVYAESRTPPFLPQESAEGVDELVRLRYRYIDLRRPELQAHFRMRDHVIRAMRDFFAAEGFWEVETPALARSTPEGARDFLVPSRLQPGHFYALPQSPQIFKQLLMVAGFDRYYQIVKAFRDEDLRADRQPEFTQLDVEMSFMSRDEILELMERMIRTVFRTTLGTDPGPMPRMTYAEAMRLYGSDKPDLRAGPPLVDLTAASRELGWSLLREAPAVSGVRIPDWHPSRRELDAWVERARALGLGGLVWILREGDGWRSSAGKWLGEDGMATLGTVAGLRPGDGLLVAAGPEAEVLAAAGSLRVEAAQALGRLEEGWRFLWVTDFPMFEWSQEEQRLTAMHHPFTMPKEADWERLESDPLACRAEAYDVVLNGVELASGSLRIYDPGLQRRIFAILGLGDQEIEEKFGFLVRAFQYGAPPHGGIAFGLDRLVMLMVGARTIREVIAFPKTASGTDPLMEAPAPVDPRQLRELGLTLIRDRGRA
ncbi:aspartyl-tRNA synthetase, promiscuous (also recognizes tRNAasn) [Candidatus Hydrogenisulfobacillus filiaventi]|uniref:Aspartate--tRNA(Asp/Asn) ligase n=1 Tax=Candidatus Hydrogenisulfobacillus filiaventi TaxID=2707344 RepID=A0A6F8ZH39_9FIRM|nr:aspartate--tRNA ligase [Bacillota bacterium]CAB1128970.1 aspartyl-tRNA synthetase, promiscuous (also recognizes tRNAasn) [Candidatus Hydrogenisulfobacillus filiaventi]